MSGNPTVANAITTLPTSLPGDGIFDVTTNIPDGTFSDPSLNDSTYSGYILDPSTLIGTSSAPYQPIANSVYIATLYENCYNINRNLQNDISAVAVDDRQYPTSYAVQTYVQSQIAGTQIIDSTTSPVVVTTLNNTVIEEVNVLTGDPNTALYTTYEYNYPTGVTDASGNTSRIADVAVYPMDLSANDPRNGATKMVVFADSTYGGRQTGDLIFLDAGDTGSKFIYAGQEMRYYQFTFLGDNVEFVMLYNSTESAWRFLVTNCNSLFTNSIPPAQAPQT